MDASSTVARADDPRDATDERGRHALAGRRWRGRLREYVEPGRRRLRREPRASRPALEGRVRLLRRVSRRCSVSPRAGRPAPAPSGPTCLASERELAAVDPVGRARLPRPGIVGKTISRSSSTRSCSSSGVRTSVARRRRRIVRRSTSGFASSAGTSSAITVVLFHAGSASASSRRRPSGKSVELVGRTRPRARRPLAANPSYVVREQVHVAPITSPSSLNAFPSSPRSYSRRPAAVLEALGAARILGAPSTPTLNSPSPPRSCPSRPPISRRCFPT